MEIFDTHAHLDLPDYNDERPLVIKRTFEQSVCGVINVGFDIPSSIRSVELARNNDLIWATVGIHPHEAKTWNNEVADKIKKMATENPKVVAIGEIGLDYYRNLSEPNQQMKAFEEQLELAKELDMPIVIHNRDASGDIVRTLQKHKPKNVLLHCFSADTMVAKWIFDQGYMISFGGSITYPKNDWLWEVVKMSPRELFVLETDCPYLSPVPLRGRRNEPAYIRHTLIKVSTLLDLNPDEVANFTTANARRFFKLLR
jgi:TatD DNase family protein